MKRRASTLFVPLLFGVVLLGAYWLVREQQILNETALRWLFFIALSPLIFFVVRLFDFLTFDVVSRRRSVRAPLLLREMFAVILYFVLFGWAISTILNYSVTGFLATGTIVAAVLGLAMQETLGNLFAGIALHLEDSFETGDVIRSGEFIGVVEDIRWRGTRLRTFNNDIVIVPNSALARERVEIFPRNNFNARLLQFKVDFNIPPAQVIAILVQAAENVEGVAQEIPCIARVGAFGDFATVYEIKYFMRDYSQRDRIDADIRKAVWYALRRNNIPIPFPTSAFANYLPPADRHSVNADEILVQLRQVDVLSPLSDEALRKIAMSARVHRFSRGETLIRRGAESDSMLIVHEGTIAVRLDDRELAQLGPGAVVGEMALLTGETRTADVVALTDVTATEIAKDALQPILQDHPDLAAAISAKVAARRGTLSSLPIADVEEEEGMLDRIKAYFGLGS